jgi:hypothetical protein
MEPAKSVMNIRPPFKSSARPIPSIRWVKTISGYCRYLSGSHHRRAVKSRRKFHGTERILTPATMILS